MGEKSSLLTTYSEEEIQGTESQSTGPGRTKQSLERKLHKKYKKTLYYVKNGEWWYKMVLEMTNKGGKGSYGPAFGQTTMYHYLSLSL